MTDYIFRIPKITFALLLALSFVVIGSNKAVAQYHGAYSGTEEIDENAEPEVMVPQVFTSQVSSVDQVKRLDIVYDELHASLWNYAISDLNFQKQLYALLEDKRFKTTRYAAEFSNILRSSMENLNENHKKMQKAIEDANADFKYVRERVRKTDQETLDKLWEEKIEEYKNSADGYFKLQHKFLKTYRTVVAFILEQGGGYYYNGPEKKMKFYKPGAYEFYVKALDKLHVISYEQIKLLKANPPANMDPDLLR